MTPYIPLVITLLVGIAMGFASWQAGVLNLFLYGVGLLFLSIISLVLLEMGEA